MRPPARSTWLETEVNGEGGVEDFVDPDAVSVSPDGANVYVAGDVALTVFARSAGDGALDFVEAEQGAGGGASFQLRDVVVSPDNSSVYVTSHLQNAVALLDRDTDDMGKVSVSQVISDGVGGVTGLYLAAKLAISPDGANIYATGALSPTGVVSATIVVFERGGDGMLTYEETLVNGEDGVDGMAGARSVEVSADGQNVYVAGTTGDSLAVFNRGGGGSLSFAECFTASTGSTSCNQDTPGLVNPSGIALSGDGSSLYVTGKESDSLSHFERNTGGSLTFANVLFNSDGGVLGLGGADDVAVSPDGKHVYVSAERDNAITVFERSAGAMGTLQFVEVQKEGVDGVKGLLEASSVTVSPDGNHVYATGYELGTVVVFVRDAATGTLTYVETKQQGESNIAGLTGAWSAALSPDGQNLYATGSVDDAIAAFSRDASTGMLTQVQLQIEGVSGVTGLRGASGIVVSPDGNQVYVTGTDDDSVVAFRRDGPNGELTFIEAYSGLDALNGAIDVDVSADGGNVYVASVIGGTVTAFGRDATSGKLTHEGAFVRAEEEPSGAEAADGQALATVFWSVAVSPDGKNVYGASWDVRELDRRPGWKYRGLRAGRGQRATLQGADAAQ